MDHEPSQHAGLSEPQLAVPLDGIAQILSGWSGQGGLFQALGGVDASDSDERAWDERSIRRRAGRILLEHARADLEHWPATVEDWLPHLPIASQAQTVVSRVPHGRVDWRETSRRFGWPARSFVTRFRQREIADVTVTTLAWTVDTLDRIVEEARSGIDEVEPRIDLPLSAAREALAFTTIPDELPRPDRHDLESLLSSGLPWAAVEPVASKIVRSQTDLLWFATQLLAPDPDFRWRLFHLAVMGHTLIALRDAGATVKWRAPMGTGAAGPNFVASLPDGTVIDVWFEASGAHTHYGLGRSAYSQAVRAVHRAHSSIGADIGLFIPGRGKALMLECKFSSYAPYVARNGFHQAAGYAADLQAFFERAWSYVVGPEEVVSGTSSTRIPGTSGEVVLGVTAVPGLASLVADFLAAS